MDQKYQEGDKILYLSVDNKGREKWLPGVIHGVKTHESNTGVITYLAYLIDTGNSVYEDTLTYNKQDVHIMKEAHAIIHENTPTHIHDDHPDYLTIMNKVTASAYEQAAKGKLPSPELVETTFRQPEQIELTDEFIKPLA